MRRAPETVEAKTGSASPTLLSSRSVEEARRPGVGGLGRGFLQEGQPDLEAIVGGETRFDEPGQ